MIELRQLSKRYGEQTVVDQLDLTVQSGEFVALLGESGSGKTTTLKCINRLVEPTSGQVLVHGADIATLDPVALRRGIGVVFQQVGLFPHWTVRRNVETVPRLLGWDAARTTARVDSLLEWVGLPPATFADRAPTELSGGQAQRVGIARALAAEVPILLLDEPFGALDPVTRDGLQRDVRALHLRLGLTTVMVTHDVVEALRMADRVGVMRDGTLLQVAPPAELVSAPAHPYVAELIDTTRQQLHRLESTLGAGS